MSVSSLFRIEGLEPAFKITERIAQTVLNVVNEGLTSGLGNAKPGQMCVEAAVCYATGEHHNDHPTCVDDQIANEKIHINDMPNVWSTKDARAKSLAPLAIAQLGTAEWSLTTKVQSFWDDYEEARDTYFKKWLRRAVTGPNRNKNLYEFYTDSCEELVADGEKFTLTEWLNDVEIFQHDLDPDIIRAFAPEVRLRIMDGWIALFVKLLKKHKAPGTKFLYLLGHSARTKK